jgi:non-ribosomal peptide synthetase component E (peptide arylation enzyme)
VVAKEGARVDLAGMRARCAEKLSDYKVPDALVLVDEIPLTPMMKVDTRQLALLAEQAAGDRLADRARRGQ